MIKINLSKKAKDSVTINTGNNTNIKGAVIANITNYNSVILSGSEGSQAFIDGSNLNINTKTLTYTNLYDHDKARSFGIGLGGNLRSGGKGSASLSLSYSMHEFEQTTNATIGNGSIKTGTTLNLDSDNNLVSVIGGDDYFGSLNRDINSAQVITKYLEVNPISMRETYDHDNRDKSSNEERRTIWSDLKNSSNEESKSIATVASTVASGVLSNLTTDLKSFAVQINPINAFSNITYGIATDLNNIGRELDFDQKQTQKITDIIKYSPYLIATLPKVGPIAVSGWIDANNNGIDEKTNKPKDFGPPNLLTGLFYLDDNPTVGRGDEGCKSGVFCKYTISDKALHFQLLHYGIPGFKSFSEFHDAGMTDKNGKEYDGTYKALSIFPYLPISYYGSFGTYLKDTVKEYNKQ